MSIASELAFQLILTR